jgi:hypothetical protein
MSERERVGGVTRRLERPILLPEMHKIQRWRRSTGAYG